MKQLLFILTLLPAVALAQLNVVAVEKVIRSTYNLEFKKADSLLEHMDSGTPAYYLLKANNIKWSNYPIIEDKSPIISQFLAYLDSAEMLASTHLSSDKDSPEYAYYYLSAIIMRAEYLATNDHMLKASLEGKKVLNIIKRGFEWAEQEPEYLTTTGLYNYYIHLYREKGFFYQTMLWPFPDASKHDGLYYLKRAAEEALFTQAEAKMFLAHLYLRMEDNPEQALVYSEQLIAEYPENYYFRQLHIEALLAANQADEAALQLNLVDTSDPYSTAKTHLYQAISDIQRKRTSVGYELPEVIAALEKLDGDQSHYLSLAYYYLSKTISNSEEQDKALSQAADFAKYPFMIKKLKEHGA